ncbi:MAG: hypothetical protein ACREVI_01200 [Steroidobacteraceae bacterium]
MLNLNTAARRMLVAASASSSQGLSLESECSLDGFDRPVAAGRSFDAAADPIERADSGAGRVDGGIELIQKICRDMQAQGEVCILLAGSAPDCMPARFHPAYDSARKEASSFSWTLGDELKDTDITAVCVLPGLAGRDYFGRHDEPIERVAADVSLAWNKLHAAMTQFMLWTTSLLGLQRA